MPYDAKWDELTVDGKINAISTQLEALTISVKALVAISNSIDWASVFAVHPKAGAPAPPVGGGGGVPVPPPWPKV